MTMWRLKEAHFTKGFRSLPKFFIDAFLIPLNIRDWYEMLGFVENRKL